MSAVALAVDFGGTKVEAALVDADGVVIAGSRHRAPTGPTATSEGLEASVTGVVQQTLAALGDAELLGVGIGSAGPLAGDGRVSPLNVPAWRGYPLRDLVAGVVPDVPVTLRMDGIAITLAETWVGAAVGETDVMGMVVSTGVGGGLLSGGRAISGPSGNAGHIGHVEIAGFDDPCACGRSGCLEAVASGPRSVRWAQQQGFTGSTGEELAVAAAAGDETAIRAIVRSATAVGRAVASASALVDVSIVAIGGGFSNVAPDYLDHVRSAADAGFDFVRDVRIVPSGLSGLGPLIGAGALVHLGERV